MEAVLSYLLEISPWVAVMFVVGVAAWNLSKYHSKLEDTNKKVDNLPCHEHEDRMSDFKDELEKLPCSLRADELTLLKQDSQKIAKSIDAIERFLIKNTDNGYQEFTRMNSPRQLNEKGIRLFEASGAALFFENKKSALLRMLEQESVKIKSALDVEDNAIRTCLYISGNDDFIPIKNFIYGHPRFEDADINLRYLYTTLPRNISNKKS